MRVDAVLFDKDGTLFDFAATWEAWAKSFLLRLTDGDQTRAAQIGRQIGFDFQKMAFDPGSIVIAGTPGEVAAALAQHIPDMPQNQLIDVLNEEAANAPQAEAVPLIPFLSDLQSKGLRLGVATNDAEAPALQHLGKAGVVDRFDFIAGYDSGHGAKPGPGQLLAFAAHVGCAPDRIAMVGDSTHDLIAGRAAGMQTVAVLTGMAGPNTLAPHADVILPDIGHLSDWIMQPLDDC